MLLCLPIRSGCQSTPIGIFLVGVSRCCIRRGRTSDVTQMYLARHLPLAVLALNCMVLFLGSCYHIFRHLFFQVLLLFSSSNFLVIWQMIGMEPWVNAEKTHVLEDLLVKLKEDALAPNMYTYNGILFV